MVVGRRREEAGRLPVWAWGGATLAAMWFRPIMNLPGAVLTGSQRGDEAKIAFFLGFGHLHLALLAAEGRRCRFARACSGPWRCCLRADRAPWVVGTALGGGVGILLWHNVVGPALLP